MNAKDLSLNDSCKRKVVKSISEIVPYIMVAILFGNFVVEAVNCGDVSRLVISSQQYYCLRIFELIQKKQQNRLD